MIARRISPALAFLLLTACTTPSLVSSETTPSSPLLTPPPPSREVVILLPAPPDSLNPLRARSWSSRAVQDLFLAGLWRLDDRLSLVPELAADIPTRANGGISSDGLTLTVHLRPDAVWSDGQPLTADDVVFTCEMALAEGNHLPTSFPYDPFVETVVALDAHTVQLRFTRPFAPWPATLFPFVLPRHILEPAFNRAESLDLAVWNRAPTVGSGPFVYVEREGENLLFEANPHYWRGRPAIDLVRVRVVADPIAQWAAITEGAADLASFLWPEAPPSSALPPDTRLLTSPSGYVETLLFNMDPRVGHPALQETAVRLALSQAIDRERVCAALAGEEAQTAQTLWSGSVFENPALGIPLPSTPEAARLLDGAGWQDTDGDGVREREEITLVLRYATPADEPDRSAAQTALAEMLAVVGARMEPATFGSGWPGDDAPEWDVAQWAEQPAGYPDPDDPRWLCAEARPGGHNVAGVCDEELDQLLVAQAAAADLDERTALIFQVQDLAQQQAWWVPLCRWEDLWVVRGNLAGPRPWRGAPFWNIWEWTLDS